MIGAGLAGTEAAWQVAQAGIPVTLVEMRPLRRSPAHHSSEFGELVCSNSFGALSSDRAAGLLQEELRRLGHHVERQGGGGMGGYQAIMINAETGMLHGGTDPRKDGQVAGY